MGQLKDIDSNGRTLSRPFFNGTLVDHCLADSIIEFRARTIHCRPQDGLETLVTEFSESRPINAPRYRNIAAARLILPAAFLRYNFGLVASARRRSRRLVHVNPYSYRAVLPNLFEH